MKVVFLSPAIRELEDAFSWYQEQMDGLGHEFLNEIDECVRRIVSWPGMHRILRKNVRRCLVRRFPYGLMYEIHIDTIIVMAVAHLHRKPFYWSVRVG